MSRVMPQVSRFWAALYTEVRESMTLSEGKTIFATCTKSGRIHSLSSATLSGKDKAHFCKARAQCKPFGMDTP